MPKKTLSDEAKYHAVMDVLEGRDSAAEICTGYGISQTYFYKLRDKAAAAIPASLKVGFGRKSTEAGQLSHELEKAKQFIGDQMLLIAALKKRGP